jgi:hypothetical protein
MTEPITNWVDPDGTATQPGGHPHYALWNHETQGWDPVPPGWTLVPTADAVVALRQENERLRVVVERLVKRTPFLPTHGGITATLSFEQMTEAREALDSRCAS